MNAKTILDPRHKELPFLSEADRKEIIEQVEDELNVMDMMMYIAIANRTHSKRSQKKLQQPSHHYTKEKSCDYSAWGPVLQ